MNSEPDPSPRLPDKPLLTVAAEMRVAYNQIENNQARLSYSWDFARDLKDIIEQLHSVDQNVPTMYGYHLYHLLIGSKIQGALVDLPDGDLGRYLKAESLEEQQAIGAEILAKYRGQLEAQSDLDTSTPLD